MLLGQIDCPRHSGDQVSAQVPSPGLPYPPLGFKQHTRRSAETFTLR